MNPANTYLLKVNNRNTRKRCEICSKLTIKTPDRHPIFTGKYLCWSLILIKLEAFRPETLSCDNLKKTGPLCEKCPNAECFLVLHFSYMD